MPRALSCSAPEKWPTEPELVVSDGEALLRIPPLPRWLIIIDIVGLALFLFSALPILLIPWLAWKWLGIIGLASVASPAFLLNLGFVLIEVFVISIAIWNTSRFGNTGTELRVAHGELQYRRPTFLRGIRMSTYRTDRIVELLAEAKAARRGKTRVAIHIRFRRRFPIRRVMKASDPSLPAKIENAFHTALGIQPANGAATPQPRTE